MTIPHYDSNIEKAFSTFLQERGYPKDSIVYGPVLNLKGSSRSFRPDFVIVDPEKNEWLAVVEVKGSLGDHKRVQEQVRTFRDILDDHTIPIFLVTPADGSESALPFQLHIYDDESKSLEPADFSFFPSFAALTADETAERKNNIRKKRTRVLSSDLPPCVGPG